MSVVKRFVIPNRLAGFVNTATGVTPDEAVSAAEERLEAIRPPSLEQLDALLAEMGALDIARPTSASAERLYQLANVLAGAAGVFGRPAQGQAAWSLCELIDRTGVEGWSAPAVAVHLEGLRLLRQEGAGLGPESCAAVLTGLEQVVAKSAPPA